MARVITDEHLKSDLIAISRIRNKFAHDLTVASFDEQPVSQWIKNMHSYKLIQKLAERKTAGANQFLRAYEGWTRQTKRKALRTLRAAYIECLGHVLHNLIVNVEDEHEAKSKGTPKRDYPFGSSGAGKMDLLPRAKAWKPKPLPKKS